MAGYGQFCAVARAHEALGGRWTLLIIRELLGGPRRFNDIRRGIPRISRTMLSERLQALQHLGVIRHDGSDYCLTESGAELAPLVIGLGTWGQRWLPRAADQEDIDADPLFLDMQRRLLLPALPPEPLVIRLEFRSHPLRFLLLKGAESTLCSQNPGFPEPLRLGGPLAALTGWWRGDHDFAEARHRGLTLDGPRELIRAFPDWFGRYLLAPVPPA